MLNTELKHITLSGKEYPIKCDMVVLEKIQDEFGDLSEFENLLSGFRPILNEDGTKKRNEEGFLVGRYGIPGIKELNTTLCWMINEGIIIEESQEPLLSKEQAARLVDIRPEDLGKALHEEFMRCFERKNDETPQN